MAIHEADAVFQGGGVKGLGLVGAVLEFSDRATHPGAYVDHWIQLAGTSAGAIIAAYLACGNTADDTRRLVAGAPYASFQDWGPGGAVIGGGLNLVRLHGLAHGEVFRDWFDHAIGGRTFADIEGGGRALKLIAADITRREMLVLPDALARYRLDEGGPAIDPGGFPIADAVRMSMSIPYFFQPVRLVHDETGLESTIVDGGVLSNFPVWIFDVEARDAVRPTFGFRLIGGRGVGEGLDLLIRTLGWPAQMGADIFHTSTDAWDKHWLSHATLVRTIAVPAGDIGTTDFDLTEAQRDRLLDSGRRAAAEFLATWRPEDYVNRAGRGLEPSLIT
jgi:NTE family protein